jgi:sterol desaturase/sphingolipid hydroxylase (fatty acid hydroxylase superfamily)
MLEMELSHWCKIIQLSLFYLYPGLDYFTMLVVGDVSKMDTYTVFIVGSFTIQLCSLCAAITFYIINKLRLPIFEQYRIHKEDWLWFNEDKEISEKAIKLNKKSLFEFFSGNVLLFIILLLTVSRDDTDKMRNKPFQPFYQRLFNIIAMLLIFETYFYWTHRLAHSVPQLYKYHKVHHEYTQPNALTGFHGSIVDALISVVPGVALCMVVLDLHLYTIWMFLLIHALRTVIDHCGYEFPWNPFDFVPFGSCIQMHNLHHSKNVGNYGLFWPLWDPICGTYIEKK